MPMRCIFQASFLQRKVKLANTSQFAKIMFDGENEENNIHLQQKNICIMNK